MINSRRKGAVGERLLRDELIAGGFPARRGQQFRGSPDSPDIIVPGLPDIHWESKFVNAGNLYTWLEQAINDSGDKIPVVGHKRNNKDWVAVLRLADLLKILNGSLYDER